MAIHSTPANKAAASRPYSKLSLSNLDLDDGGGKGSGIYNAACNVIGKYPGHASNLATSKIRKFILNILTTT